MGMENFEPGKKAENAEIGPVIVERKETEHNLTEKFEKLYRLASTVTRPSHFARSENDREGRERPLFLRAQRAELYKQLKGKERIDQENIISEAHMRDNIAEQYLNQHDLRLQFSEYGEIGARTVDIMPPEALITPEKKDLPPIFLIPGIANDLEVVNNMASEMVMQGRRVVVLAQPESIKGQITPEFAEAVDHDPKFGPHTAFYGEALKHIFKDGQNFELWGFSTGGAISAQLLNDPEFQQRVTNAVFIAPAGFVKQSRAALTLGIANDFLIYKNDRSVHFVMGHGFEKNKQLELHDKVVGSLTKRIMEANDNWKGAHVKEGGSIVVVSGKRDLMTKSASMSKEFLQNQQMRVLDLPGAYHMTPQLEADTVIPEIMAKQK